MGANTGTHLSARLLRRLNEKQENIPEVGVLKNHNPSSSPCYRSFPGKLA